MTSFNGDPTCEHLFEGEPPRLGERVKFQCRCGLRLEAIVRVSPKGFVLDGETVTVELTNVEIPAP